MGPGGLCWSSVLNLSLPPQRLRPDTRPEHQDPVSHLAKFPLRITDFIYTTCLLIQLLDWSFSTCRSASCFFRKLCCTQTPVLIHMVLSPPSSSTAEAALSWWAREPVGLLRVPSGQRLYSNMLTSKWKNPFFV